MHNEKGPMHRDKCLGDNSLELFQSTLRILFADVQNARSAGGMAAATNASGCPPGISLAG